MFYTNNNSSGRGLDKRSGQPRLVGDILAEMLSGNSPLAKGYRKYLASKENGAEKGGMKVNTELCVDLKTKLQNEVLMKPGKEYPGILRRDVESEDYGFDDSHYTFIETLPPTAGKRNPHVFCGKYITITRRDDGSLRPNFKPMKLDADFTIVGYAFGVAKELIKAFKGLIEGKAAE